ncbi:MAG TPA: LCP family protein [Anaerolineales bacterium]|nr:LCP family protein [Anaerolineales bacterium]
MRRAQLVCALAVVLAGCTSGKVVPGIEPPPKAASAVAEGTPFGPADVTITPPQPPVVPPTPDFWLPPGSYGNPNPLTTAVPSPAPPVLLPPGTRNVLLLGSDRRTGSGFRTDVIILASLQPENHAVTLLTIPRDLYVYQPGYTVTRINTAWINGETIGYPGGGPALLFDTIRYNLGLHVDHYALVEMSGFEQAIDTLGGVEVRVACSYTDWRLKSANVNPNVVSNWRLYTVPAGLVQMDGNLALWYARSRARSSDFDRSRRQHEVLRAVYRRALSIDAFARLPGFYADLTRVVYTDIGLADAGSLGLAVARISPDRIHSRFIGRGLVTGWRVPVSGAQVLLPKPDRIQALLQEAFTFPEEQEALVPQVVVEVVDAAGRPDWASLAVDRLEYAGMAATLGGAADEREPISLLLDFGQAGDEERLRVLRALGLRESAVVPSADASAPAAFRFILGENFDPCFDPTIPIS